MDTQPEKRLKNTRLGLSLAERIQVIEARQNGKSMRQLATQFGCGKTQILNTLAQKDRYIQEWELLGGRNNPILSARKRFRHTRNEEINRSVYQWYQQQQSDGHSVTGPMLQREARLCAANLGITTFAASNGWLANFRRFYNISSPHPRKPYLKSLKEKKYPEADQAAGPSSSQSEETDAVARKIAQGLDNSAKVGHFLGPPEEDQSVENISQDQMKGSSTEIVPESALKLDLNQICKSTSNFLPQSGVRGSILPDSNNLGAQSCSLPGNETHQNCNSSRPIPSSFNNHHWKRRFLQNRETSVITTTNQLTPVDNHQNNANLEQVNLTHVENLARSRGFSTTLVKDGNGDDFLEIRPSIASYHVPKYNYPTHLTRLIVNPILQYFVEVLGRCVRNGTLNKDSNHSWNITEIVSILDALNGDFIVCQGVKNVAKLRPDLYMKAAQDVDLCDNLYLTLPDYRYRSLDCVLWMDRGLGQRCANCNSYTSKASDVDFHSHPMDLRCNPHL